MRGFLVLFPGLAFSHPGHEERGLIPAFLDHVISDFPGLAAVALCAAIVLFARLKKRKAKK
jgi:hypothetical protein